MTPPLMDVRRVSRTFRVNRGLFRPSGTLEALRDVSLTLYRGEILALVGESGSGKSTLSRIMLGLDRPTAGDVLLDGTSVGTIPRRRLAARVQPIFQDPYSSLNPYRTVRQIIEMPLIVNKRMSAPARRRAIADILDILRMPRRTLEAYPSQMSGGQRQRVAIARALIARPEIVICDEPTSALDVSVQAQVLNLLMDLRAEFNLTYLFISHDLAVVEYIADRIAVMKSGEIVEVDKYDGLLRNPKTEYTRTLISSTLPVPEMSAFEQTCV
ncbi:ATP-binding cassette domain-containing protein [Rhodospira trueperi]|uniref:Peptide/nickel transport system ATP-binding protein n=1 Tax=Rhodospira trueperi TaxID=69960 RepID=A0A1G7GMM3_9PROT|nr:ATP-binding cassette domain-containing protein [Rhodospira trueperi]SDE89239.1 peptide/nickel transport system ATP-binding protein [Rhodospira trueperi]